MSVGVPVISATISGDIMRVATVPRRCSASGRECGDGIGATEGSDGERACCLQQYRTRNRQRRAPLDKKKSVLMIACIDLGPTGRTIIHRHAAWPLF